MCRIPFIAARIYDPTETCHAREHRFGQHLRKLRGDPIVSPDAPIENLFKRRKAGLLIPPELNEKGYARIQRRAKALSPQSSWGVGHFTFHSVRQAMRTL